MPEVLRFVDSYSAEALLGLACLTVILLFYCIAVSRKLSRAARKRGQKPPGESVGEIMDCLREHADAISELQARSSDLTGRLDEQSRLLRKCLQRVGMVRFNAFDDVGGEQSFALVLLDAEGDGVAVSSIYGRQDSRIYAKTITRSAGERPLSDEEMLALRGALSADTPATGAQRSPS